MDLTYAIRGRPGQPRPSDVRAELVADDPYLGGEFQHLDARVQTEKQITCQISGTGVLLIVVARSSKRGVYTKRKGPTIHIGKILSYLHTDPWLILGPVTCIMFSSMVTLYFST